METQPTRKSTSLKAQSNPEDIADGLIQHRKHKVRLHITCVKKHVSPIEIDTKILRKEDKS